MSSPLTSSIPTSPEDSSHAAAGSGSTATCMEPSSSNLVEDHDKLRMPVEHGGEEGVEDQVDRLSRRESVSSDDSFYSASGERAENKLYLLASKLVQEGAVRCRKNR